jgi:hypothetical protein
MNFKLERFCYLTISFILGLFFFIVGIFGLLFPWISFLQKVLMHFLLETLLLSLLSLCLAGIGVSIIIYALLNSRKHYLHVSTGANAVLVDQAIVHQYLEKYWQKLFPATYIPFHVTFKKHAIQIVVDFPALPLNEQKSFLEQIRQDFSELFESTLGYPHEVHLIASFQNKKLENSV